MSYGFLKPVMGLGVALLLAGAGLASAESPVSTNMQVLEVIKKDGKESFKPAKTVLPGEMLEYRIAYTNHGGSPFTGLKVNGPVPTGTSYVAGSASSATPHSLRYSADGGKSWQDAPLKKTITGADGKQAQVVVPTDEYTNVQWVVKDSLAPGATQEYVYRVVVRP